jgi:cold shock CspA family protein
MGQGVMATGTVKNVGGNFGFIVDAETGADVFFGKRKVRHIDQFSVGDLVEYVANTDRHQRTPEATEVKLIRRSVARHRTYFRA